MPLTRRGASTNLPTMNEPFGNNRRQKNSSVAKQSQPAESSGMNTRHKRRSSGSPTDNGPKKRTAFGDITNNALQNKKKEGIKKVYRVSSNRARDVKASSSDRLAPLATQEEDEDESMEIVMEISQSSSQESTSSTDSEVQFMNKKNQEKSKADKEEEMIDEVCMKLAITDIDEENKHDPNLAPVYANDIFKYYKQRELLFQITPYVEKQKDITRNMRAILVDWLVEVQENFELNHETLYLAVKIVDRYLMEANVPRETLQLVGATALFIACKFDERCPPVLDDFIFICDDAYKRNEFLCMERTVLKTLGFDIGMPLSYRFLRRYAKCAKANMETLTLARYVLELTLQEYDFIECLDSHIAASALLLAFKMKKTQEWDTTLEYYSGYKSEELMQCVRQLNALVASQPNKQLMTVRNKYSHKIFFEVAKVPPVDVLEL
ncbi:G2/mitotic-specific cyclin-B3-like [Ptychodera flava]|uniref:G2/mitotic-specific cyclin-B3-like n=1 Tax=Ptychodera flava TaxID=63121 RepID=UPI00396A6F36